MNETLNDRLHGIAKLAIGVLLFVLCIACAAVNCYAGTRRRAVSPPSHFPAYAPLRQSCLFASIYSADIADVRIIVDRYQANGVPVPPELVRALGVYAENVELLRLMHDDYACFPPLALQTVGLAQAHDLLDSIVEILAIGGELKGP